MTSASTSPAAVEMSRWQRSAGALRYRDYRYLWIGQLCSAQAQWMDEVVRGWIAYQLTGSPFILGLVSASRHAPLLVFGPWAGVLADRFDRRWQLLIAQWANALVDLALVGLLLNGWLEAWHLVALALTAGSVQSFMQPARQAMLPQLVPRADLMSGIALLQVAFNLSRGVGPAVAGLLIGFSGPVSAVAGEVLLHFISGLTVLMMRQVPRPEPVQRGSLWGDLVEGVRYVWVTPPLALLVAIALVPMLVAFPYNALLPVYAQDILLIGPEGLGFLYTAAGAGGISGLVALGLLGDLPRKGAKMLFALGGWGVALLIFAYSPFLALSLALIFIFGLAANVFHAFANHLLQVATEDRYRGRVMSLYALDRGFFPLGLLSVGTLAQLFSAPIALIIMAALLLLITGGVAVRWPSLRRLA